MKKILLGGFALLISVSCLADPAPSAAVPTVPSAAISEILKSLVALDGGESIVEFEGSPKAPPEGSVKSVFAATNATHFKLTRMSKGADGAWTATLTDEYEFLPEQRDTGSGYKAAFCGHLKRTPLKHPEQAKSYFLDCRLDLDHGAPTLNLSLYQTAAGAIPDPADRKAVVSYIAWEYTRNSLSIQEQNPKKPEMKATQWFKR